MLWSYLSGLPPIELFAAEDLPLLFGRWFALTIIVFSFEWAELNNKSCGNFEGKKKPPNLIKLELNENLTEITRLSDKPGATESEQKLSVSKLESQHSSSTLFSRVSPSNKFAGAADARSPSLSPSLLTVKRNPSGTVECRNFLRFIRSISTTLNREPFRLSRGRHSFKRTS